MSYKLQLQPETTRSLLTTTLLIFALSCVLFSIAGCGKRSETVTIEPYSKSQFPERTANFASTSFKYRIYRPPNRDPGERLPVILYLHGSDDRGNDNELQLRGLAEYLGNHAQDFPFIVVFPQCGTDRFWDREMAAQAIVALNQTRAEFGGDENQLYLAGFSLGGYGVWHMAAMYPGKFAAIVPMSGRLLPRSGERKSVDPHILELADAPDPYAAVAQVIGKTPTWIFHGSNDNIVPVENSRKMMQALRNAGNNNVRYTELPNTGHYSLDLAINDSELFKWLAQQHLGD